MKMVRHCAKYHDSFIAIFADLLKSSPDVLDPLAGVGKLALIRDHGYTGRIYLNELEPEWAWQAAGKVAGITVLDARGLPYSGGFFSAICTSPTFGNRLADHHNAKDDSKRSGYKFSLGRDLTTGNTGQMQWGDEYRITHKAIWTECRRVLQDGGLFVLNMKDHYRKGKRIRVTLWHILCLRSLGFGLIEHRRMPTPSLRYGANSDKRIGYESILVFRKEARR